MYEGVSGEGEVWVERMIRGRFDWGGDVRLDGEIASIARRIKGRVRSVLCQRDCYLRRRFWDYVPIG